MNEELLFADAVLDSVSHCAAKALEHFEAENLDYASAIINEWTTESHECVLTHHYLDTTHEVKDPLMFMSINDKNQLGYGTFTLCPETDLTTQTTDELD